jgi:hypothetical protein
MEIKFISHVRRGNKRGTGFLYIPKEKSALINLKTRVKVKLHPRIYFFSQIVKHNGRLGIYIPQRIMEENDLLNKKIKVQLNKIEGFYARIGSDGRVYIPGEVAKSKFLQNNSIISIKVFENGKVILEKYVKVYLYSRPNRKEKEFMCYVDKKLHGKNLIFNIETFPVKPQKRKINPLIAQLLRGMRYAFINEDSAIIFKGNKLPAIINTNFKLSDLAFYLGAYFSDGTRKGNNWAICASTFEQARYYLKMHSSLIKDSKPEFTISYTNIYNVEENKLKKDLAEIWQKEIGIKVDRFRIRKPSGKSISKWNKYGTLVIREHRQILLNVYNRILRLIIERILSQKDKNLAADFICGVMEGDGCASAWERGNVMIFTNKNDVHTLENIFKVAKIKFRTYRDEKNKYSLRIGALEILKNFDLLKDKIFILYPKRRKALFERLKTVKTVKFLIENYSPTPGIKSWLRNNGFCDENYKITEKGLKLKNELIENLEKVRV